jgi:Putative zinc-finger
MQDTIKDSLRRIFKEGSGKAERRWGCLTESEIAAFADRRMTGQGKERLESHLERCSSCREQVAFLAGFDETETPQAVPAAWLARARDLAGSRGQRRPVWRWGAAAAAAACLVLVATLTLQRPRQGARSVPAPTPAASVRGRTSFSPLPKLIFPGSGTSVSSGGLRFRWKSVEDAREYEIDVVTTSGDLVWKEQTEDTSASLPPKVILTPGEKYFVWVRAYLRENKAVQSGAVPFVISSSN